MDSPQRIHGSCASRSGDAVLFVGPPGSGKSDLVLRLLARGFELVADDQVDLRDGFASAPPMLAGLLEVRGLGIMRLSYASRARIALVIDVAASPDRLPQPARHAALDVPLVHLDAALPSAPDRVAFALDCALGRISQVAGAFAA